MKTKFVRILIVAAIVLCAGCSMTVAPRAVTPAHVSSWAQVNILDSDATGLIVTPDYVRVYQAMLATNGSKLPVSNRPGSPSDGISPITWRGRSLVHVTYEVSDRFADLKYFERNATP